MLAGVGTLLEDSVLFDIPLVRFTHYTFHSGTLLQKAKLARPSLCFTWKIFPIDMESDEVYNSHIHQRRKDQ